MTPHKIPAMVEIDPMDLVRSLDIDEALDFICKIDLAFANVGFTENLIIRLIKSMKDDLSEKEWKIYDKVLKEIEPLSHWKHKQCKTKI